jgi:hypothetical protein
MAIKEVVLLYTMKVDNPISLLLKKKVKKQPHWHNGAAASTHLCQNN